ncbi:Terpenoid synthase [Corchorus olitorius]|uniref:Terpenoid synthase n=1 Tax=Corchorus olitorius TaxID=93759 RepID=A0A1R3J2U9_9ROSI|nr:Terpenoid synthase [Corchorus olitorius]
MKQFGVSRKEAIEAFREMIEDTWKDLNEGCMRPTPVPLQILRVIVDSFGFLDVAYKYNDEYTKQENSFKRYVKQLLIEPIPIQE